MEDRGPGTHRRDAVSALTRACLSVHPCLLSWRWRVVQRLASIYLLMCDMKRSASRLRMRMTSMVSSR